MKNELSNKPEEAAGSFDLGSVIGQRKAFGLIAGRCSAAEAAVIRRIREERLYLAGKLTWKEFCPRHLGMSRPQADRLINLLDEFGPDYFEITQLTRISPENYRAIAPAVKDGHVQWRDESIALLPENSEKIAAAVAGLLEAARPEVSPESADEAPASRFAPAMTEVQECAEQVVAKWSRLVDQRTSMPPGERQGLKNQISRTRLELERLERKVWLQAK